MITNNRLTIDLPHDGAKGIFFKILGSCFVLFLAWLGVSMCLVGPEIEALQGQIRVLEANVAELSAASSRLNQSISP